MKIKSIPKLIFSIIICQFAGIIGSVFTAPAIPSWYAGLAKPAFAPPNWLFAPVWITLYLLMGISLYIIWGKASQKSTNTRKAGKPWKNPIIFGIMLFAVQLILNTVWSLLFFGLRNPMYAFAEILALWAVIALTIWQFRKVDMKAAYLLVPYIAWVTLATFLNYFIWVLNV